MNSSVVHNNDVFIWWILCSMYCIVVVLFSWIVKQAIFSYVNHTRIRSWNQPVLHKERNVFCTRKQRGLYACHISSPESRYTPFHSECISWNDTYILILLFLIESSFLFEDISQVMLALWVVVNLICMVKPILKVWINKTTQCLLQTVHVLVLEHSVWEGI